MTKITRRETLVGATALTAVALMSSSTVMGAQDTMADKIFDMSFGPHDGMFKHSAGPDIIDQINFAVSEGFTSWEDNEMKNRTVSEQERIGQALLDNNMTMGVFVANTIDWQKVSMSVGDPEYVANFVKEMEESVEVGKRVGAKWCTVVPGVADLYLHRDYQMANLTECLKRGSDVLEKGNIIMVLEPLNNYEDHPGLLLKEIPQAYYLCKAVNSPSCKILFDMYHQQVQEGRLIGNIDAAWDEVAYFQIGDTPGRNEPTTGEINYKNVFKHIYEKGYRGIMGMEHGNSKEGEAGERAVIDAYKEVGNFL